MKAYLALMLAKKEDLATYGKEVADIIKGLSGGKMTYAEGAAGVVVIGFASNKDESVIRRSFQDLWRAEQRTWVLPLDSPLLIDQKLMDWARRQVPESPF